MKLHKALNRMREMHEAYAHATTEDSKRLAAWRDEVVQLREQNRVLLEALRVAVFLDGPDTVQPEFERWSALVDEGLKQNFNEWYGVQVLAALTATRQPVKPQRRIHACDIPGCVSCGNPEDATSQEGQG